MAITAHKRPLAVDASVGTDLWPSVPTDDERRCANLPADITEAPMPASTIHVEPNPKGRWIVRHEHERESHSEHESATEAERVALDLATVDGASLVVIHDRYSRIHELHTEDRPARTPPPRRG
jgi:hypothetical protein